MTLLFGSRDRSLMTGIYEYERYHCCSISAIILQYDETCMYLRSAITVPDHIGLIFTDTMQVKSTLRSKTPRNDSEHHHLI